MEKICRFIGKPDSKFTHLEVGKLYNLVVEERYLSLPEGGFVEFLKDGKYPVITNPILCPYRSWDTFYQNWEEIK